MTQLLTRDSARLPPHNLEMEEALLGSMLLSADAIDATAHVQPEDFYQPGHARIFEAIATLAEHGDPVDLATVAEQLSRGGHLASIGGRAHLAQLHASTPASANAGHYARVVVELAMYRGLISAAGAIAESAYTMELSALDALATARERLDRVETPIGVGAKSPTLDDVLAVAHDPQWLVPYLLERAERMLLVASEGHGKSMMLRQIAVQLAQGIHPFQLYPTRPCNVLMIDLENPQRMAARKLETMRKSAYDYNPQRYDPDRLRVEFRPDGIDITSRSDAMWLLERVAANQPDVLVIGPLYKLHDIDESKYVEVRRVQRILDRIRVRHDVTLLMETHAPHEAFGREGRLRVSGSRVWQRWPEFVLSLRPESEKDINGPWIMEHARPPRDERQWPKVLKRYGRKWPWEAVQTELHAEQEPF